jgi:hypothetical protein
MKRGAKMDRKQVVRERLMTRHRVGTYFGYFGLFFGLFSLLATTSEGTPFQPDEMGWVVFGFMLFSYSVGWMLGPTLSRLANPAP